MIVHDGCGSDNFLIKTLGDAMRTTSLILLFFIFISCQLAFAQTTEVDGTVKDDQGKPMADVKIIFQSTTIAGVKFDLTTNKKGEFYYPNLLYQGEPGSWNIYPEYEGYLVKHMKVESRDSRKELFTNIDQGVGIKQIRPEILGKPGGKMIIEFIMAPEASFEQTAIDPSLSAEALKSAQVSDFEKAQILHAQGKTEESIALFRKAAAQEKNAEIHLELSRVLLEQNRIDEASVELRNVIELDPNIPMLHFTLANILRAKGDLNGAIEELKQEAALSHDSTKALEALGALYIEAGKETEAETVYRKIIDKSPDNVNAYISLGGIYNRIGEYAKSEQAYKKVIELNPKNADMIYYNVGVSIINKSNIGSSDRESAISAFKKALEINPDHAGAHLQLGYILLGLGKFEEAKPHFKRFVELKPDSPDAETARTILQEL